jgi:hypothetical protein
MKSMNTLILASAFAVSAFVAGHAQDARKDAMNSMPNRISMNVTVPKQTQGATFGERAQAGKINITLIENGCVVLFSSGTGYLVNTKAGAVNELSSTEYAAYAKRVNQGLHAAGSAVAQGAALLGGAIPGGAIVSAAISSVTSLSNAPGGAASASYAKTSRAGQPDQGSFRIPDDKAETVLELPDGEYELSFVILEKASSGLKDTLKTQVRLGFSSVSNVLKTKHDTVKNSINNVR